MMSKAKAMSDKVPKTTLTTMSVSGRQSFVEFECGGSEKILVLVADKKSLKDRMGMKDCSTGHIFTLAAAACLIILAIFTSTVHSKFTPITEEISIPTIKQQQEDTSTEREPIKVIQTEEVVELKEKPIEKQIFVKSTIFEPASTDGRLEFDKSVFEKLYNQSKTKPTEEIVDRNDIDPPADLISFEKYVLQRRGRSKKIVRSNDKISGRTSEEILNEIVNFGLDQSKYLFDVQEKQIYDRGLKLKKTDAAHFVGVFNRQSQRAKELSKYGYATLQASSLLSKQFTLTRQQIAYDLERVELRSTDLFNECPFSENSASDVLCTGLDLLYRSADGTCNNLEHPDWGSSFMPFLRFLPPDYSDGIQEFRLAQSGKPLPSPRAISTMVHRESSDDTPPFTMMVMQWGQYLDHDLTSTPQTRGFNNSMVKCCAQDGQPLPEELRHPDCAPIAIPPNDQFYSQFNVTCMEFIRSSPAPRKDCSLGPRDPINQVTSFIDASSVYGSTPEEQKVLRLGRLGKLKYTDLHFRKPLLPALDPTSSHEMCRVSTPNLYCFAAGDTRANEQPGLTAMHTLWLREHNRIAKELAALNPHWEDERLFQESRKIVGGMVQHITYNEWLPVVLGKPVIDIFELKLKPSGYQHDYNATINPTLANAVASAAFRFGHSLVRNSLSRCTKDFQELPFFVKLHKEFNDPSNIHNLGSVDRLMLGLMSKSMAKRDEFIATELTNHLFQRGRDHGIPAYNIWRAQCGLTRFERWSHMLVVANPETIDRLSSVYEDINDVDLFTGSMSEKPVRGGIVGPTFACILGQQFLNLRKGDRFWYENGGHPGSFRPDQLQEIRKTSLARVICDNLDNVDTVQPYVFLSNEEEANRRVPCRSSAIPAMNLGRWKEEPTEARPTQFLATDSLLSKLNPLSEDPIIMPTINNNNNDEEDAIFEALSKTPELPEIHDSGPFVDEVPRQIDDRQFFEFFRDNSDSENFDNSILDLFAKDGLLKPTRR